MVNMRNPRNNPNLRALQERLQTEKARADELTAQQSALKPELTAAKRKITRLESAAASAKEAAAKSAEELRSLGYLREQLQTEKSRADELAAQQDSLRSELTAAQETISRLESDEAAAREAAAKSAEELRNVESLQEQLQTEKSRADELTTQQKALRSELTAAKRTITRLESAAASAKELEEKRAEDLRNLESLQEQLQTERSRADELTTQQDSLRSELTAAQEGISRLESAAASAREAAAKRQVDLISAHTRFSLKEPTIKGLIDRLDEIIGQQTATKAELDKARAEMSGMTREHTRLNKQVSSLQQSVQRLESTNGEYERLRQELANAQNRLSLAEPTIASLVARLEELVRERTIVQDALAGAQAESDRRIAEATERAEKAEAALQESLAKIETLIAEDDAAALIAENRRMATELAAAKSDMLRAQEAAQEFQEAVSKAAEDAEKQVRAELEKAHSVEKTRLESQVQLLTSQLESSGKTPMISPESAAALMNSFVQRLGESATGLRVTDGEIKLKVAFGAAGEQGGFLVPTVDSGPEIMGSLHEFVLRFDQPSASQRK